MMPTTRLPPVGCSPWSRLWWRPRRFFLRQIEPVIDQPAVVLLDENAHVPSAHFTGSHHRHATVTEHPHIGEGSERNELVRRERDRGGREVGKQGVLSHAEGDVHHELAAHHVVTEEREHPRLVPAA